jgi:hypothetical protein
MSGYDSTLNYDLKKPWVNNDFDVWGDHWNQNADTIDNLFLTQSNRAVVGPSPNSAGRGALWWDSVGGQLYVQYDDGNSVQFVSANSVVGLPLTGGVMSGPLTLYANATQALHAVPLQQLTAGFLPLTGGTLSGGLGLFNSTAVTTKPTVTGAWAGSPGKALCMALASYGLLNDNTTA